MERPFLTTVSLLTLGRSYMGKPLWTVKYWFKKIRG